MKRRERGFRENADSDFHALLEYLLVQPMPTTWAQKSHGDKRPIMIVCGGKFSQ